MADQLRVMIAGGGTGGHVFPMIAVADALRKKHSDCHIQFVGTKERIESKLVPQAGYQLKTVPISGLKGKSIFHRIFAVMQIPIALVKSLFLISMFGPHIVIGGGGYASWPTCRAAKLLGVPLVLMEVNSLPGMATRKLAPLAEETFIAFASTADRLKCQCRVTGNPVRTEIHGKAPKAGTGELSVLVLGGSQGAVGLNNMVIETLPFIKKSDIEVFFNHQSGKVDLERVEKAYKENRIPGKVSAFIEEMSTAYRKADLIISRAGATTVAELIAARRPAVFIPLPTAADNHQELNAQEIVDVGGGVIIRQQSSKATALADLIVDCYHRREQLQKMGEVLAALDHPLAADEIAERTIELAKQQ